LWIGLPEVGVVPCAHRGFPVDAGPVPGVWIGEDDPLGYFGLGEEEPVPPFLGEPGIGAVQRLPDRYRVEHRQPGDGLRMVHGEAERDVATAVVADHREPLHAQRRHQRHDVGGHRPFAGLRMVRAGSRRARPAVAAQVRTHNAEPGFNQLRRHPIPGGVRSRMPMQQHHRRAAPTYPNPKPHIGGDVHHLQTETLEHQPIIADDAHRPECEQSAVKPVRANPGTDKGSAQLG